MPKVRLQAQIKNSSTSKNAGIFYLPLINRAKLDWKYVGFIFI